MISSDSHSLFVVAPNHIGMRMDALLKAKFPQCSRTYLQQLIEDGDVLLNGHSIKKRIIPKLGDQISVSFRPRPGLSVEPQEIPLDLLFEDEHLLAINKPAGMTMHPAPGSPKDTLANALLFHCKHLLPYSETLRPGIVHRLDKETSGIVIVAKHHESHAKLSQLFAERKIEKNYLAICIGYPGEKTIDLTLGRHPTKRQQMAVLDTGRRAMTSIKTLHWNGQLSLVKATPLTGRTHQIRVHLSYFNTPVLGDRLYGIPSWNRSNAVPRHLLHAYALRFIHPIFGHPVDLLAPLPKDFLHFVQTHHLYPR